MRVLFENLRTGDLRVAYGREDCETWREIIAYEVAISSCDPFICGAIMATPMPEDNDEEE